MLSKSWRAETRDERRILDQLTQPIQGWIGSMPPAPSELKGYESWCSGNAKRRTHKRGLRRLIWQGYEYGAMGAGRIGGRGEKYITDFACKRQRYYDKKSAEFCASAALVSSDGRTIGLPQNGPAQRFAGIYARAKGLEVIADRAGLVAVFCTATLPSEYHPNPAVGRGSWDGLTPAEGHQELTRRWRALGRDLARAMATPPIFIRCAEPHDDACEHWHWLAYIKSGAINEYKQLCEKHFGAHGSPAFKLVVIDRTAGGACPTSYITKYLLKAVGHEFSGTDTPVDRARAWRAIWGSRALQIGGKIAHGTATLWNEARRVRLTSDGAAQKAAALGCDFLTLLKFAQGDETNRHSYADFVTHLRGAMAGRITIERERRASGTTKIKGILLDEFFFWDTHPARWFLQPGAQHDTVQPPETRIISLQINDAAVSYSYPSKASACAYTCEATPPAGENRPPAAPPPPAPTPAAPPPPPHPSAEHLAGPLGWAKSRTIYRPEQIAAGLHLPPTERQRVTNNPCVIIRHSLL